MIVPRTLIFLFRGEKILLIKGDSKKKIWAGCYNGIGGHVERGESIYFAAQRELVEETGLVIDNLWLCGTIMIDVYKKTGVGIFIFKGEVNEEIISTEFVNETAEGNLLWFSVDQISDLPLVEDLPILLPKIIANQKEDPPFSALYTYDIEGKLTVSFNK